MRLFSYSSRMKCILFGKLVLCLRDGNVKKKEKREIRYEYDKMTWNFSIFLKRVKDSDNMGIISLRAQLLIRHPSQLVLM